MTSITLAEGHALRVESTLRTMRVACDLRHLYLTKEASGGVTRFTTVTVADRHADLLRILSR